MPVRTLFGLAVLIGQMNMSADAAPETQFRTRICHIANAGFAIQGPKGTVLIDALFRDGLPDYQQASRALNDKMESGDAPFDDVRLVIATHFHADHFSANALLRHAENNPDTRYIVTPQAQESLIEAGMPDTAARRVHGIYPEKNEQVSVRHAGIIVRVFRISHGKGNPTQNNGVVVESGGLNIVHTGDMDPDPAQPAETDIRSPGVDVAMVPFWMLMSDESRKFVRGAFAARVLLPMHLPNREKDWMAEYGGLSGLRRRIEKGVPDAVWLSDEMACRKFDAP